MSPRSNARAASTLLFVCMILMLALPSVAGAAQPGIEPATPYRLFLPLVGNRFPAVPLPLTLSPIEAHEDYTLRLAWSSDPLAANYLLQQSSNSAFTADTVTAYLGPNTSWQSNVMAPGTYCYRVRGMNEIGAGTWSNVQCVQITCQPVLTDDFSNSASGWPLFDRDISAGNYASGEYRLLVKQAGYISFATPGRSAKEFRVAIDGRAAGPLNGAYGIVFHNSPGGFYLFEVATNGQFLLTRYDVDTSTHWVDLLPPASSPALRTGSATNRLEVIYVGGRIRLLANGQQLGQVYDDRYPSGTVGVVAEAGVANFDARFDNFTLYAQPCIPADPAAASAGCSASSASKSALPEYEEMKAGESLGVGK